MGRGLRLARLARLAGAAGAGTGFHHLPDRQALSHSAPRTIALRSSNAPSIAPWAFTATPRRSGWARDTSSGASRTCCRPGRFTRDTTAFTCRGSATPPATSTSTTLAVEDTGRVVFVATACNCLATLSRRCSFQPLWRPPFISKLAAEDRCHLNGLALRDGKARYVTAVSRSDVVDGWRDRRTDGGCVIDVTSGDVVAEGLSMPHSPRWYREQLWVLNSGKGEFGWVDLAAGRFEPVAFCPGYLRGLAFAGDYAIVSLSQPRQDKTFGGLALTTNWPAAMPTPSAACRSSTCKTGNVVQWLKVEGMVSEIYDVDRLARRPPADGAGLQER